MKKNIKFLIVVVFILSIASVSAEWYDPFDWSFGSQEESIEAKPSSGNTYTINMRKDISVSCYSDKGVLFIEDGQGRKLNFTGLNGYCEPIPDGQEIFLDADAPAIILTPNDLVDNVIVRANKPEAFDYLDWSVANREHNLTGKPQAWDYSENRINDYTREMSFTLKDGYEIKPGEKIIIDPEYTISNISLDTDLDNITCEGGGYFCHLSTNITEGLVFYTPFDVENNSVTVYDWTGINDGTMTSFTGGTGSGWNATGGRFDGGIDLDGDIEYIDFGSDLSLNITEEITVLIWMQSDMIDGGRHVPIGRIQTNGFNGWLLRKNDDLMEWQIRNGAGGISDSFSHTWDMDWHQFGLVYNGTNGILYHDGVEVDVSSFYDGGITYIAGETLEMGRYPDLGGTQEWNGSLDEVMIFNRSLSATEISHIYNETFPKFQSQGTQDIDFLKNNEVTIDLNLANSSVLNDDDGNLAGDSDSVLILTEGNGAFKPSAIMFNLTDVIPDGYKIDSSFLSFYLDGASNNPTYNCYEYNNFSWNEEDGISSRADVGNKLGDVFNTTVANERKQCNVSDWVRTVHSLGNENVSIALEGNSTTPDFASFSSKDHSTASQRPSLNITFSPNITGFNRVNITVQLQNQNITGLTNLSLSIWDGISQTDSQNMTNNTIATFIIDSSSTDFDLNFTYIEDANAFWSPILLPNITLDFFTVVVGEAPSIPILNAPPDLTYILDADDLNIPLNWSNSTDVDGDIITYSLQIWNESGMSNLMYSNNSINETTNTTGDIVSFPNVSNADFFWRVRAMDITNDLNSSWSGLWNISLGFTPAPPVDTCTYTSGDWDVDCSDDCTISSNVNLAGNSLWFSSAGTFTLANNIILGNIGNAWYPSVGCEFIYNDNSETWNA